VQQEMQDTRVPNDMSNSGSDAYADDSNPEEEVARSQPRKETKARTQGSKRASISPSKARQLQVYAESQARAASKALEEEEHGRQWAMAQLQVRNQQKHANAAQAQAALVHAVTMQVNMRAQAQAHAHARAMHQTRVAHSPRAATSGKEAGYSQGSQRTVKSEDGEWEDWVLDLGAKQRNHLIKERGFTKEVIDELKQTVRKRQWVHAARRYKARKRTK
jgi:hypothetical protein